MTERSPLVNLLFSWAANHISYQDGTSARYNLDKKLENEWKKTNVAEMLQYSTTCFTQGYHVFSEPEYSTTNDEILSCIVSFLEMNPLSSSQRTLAEIYELLINTSQYGAITNSEPHLEAYLRRAPVESISSIPPGEWWIYQVNPALETNFWIFTRFFYFGTSRQYKAIHQEEPFKSAFDSIIALKGRLQRATLDHSWIKEFTTNFSQVALPTESYDHFIQRFFVHYRRWHESTPRLQNLSSVPCVMREYRSFAECFADINQLQIPTIVSSMAKWRSHLTQLDNRAQCVFFLVEQTALTIRLSIEHYLTHHPTLVSLESIAVFPRTSTTCYLMGTVEAVRTLRYCMLPEMHRKYKARYDSTVVGLDQDSQKNKSYLKIMTAVVQPLVFRVVVRTWIESLCTSNTLGMQYVLLTLLRWCYMVGKKDLVMTWFLDVSRNTSAQCYSDWKWPQVPYSLTDSMIEPTNGHFVSYYQRLFEVLATGWSQDLIELHTNILSVALDKTRMDDFTLEEGSIVTFIEAYICLKAPHAISMAVIDWLYDRLVSNHFAALYDQFPPFTHTVETLHRLKQIQLDHVTTNGSEMSNAERHWRTRWLVLNEDEIPGSTMLIESYYFALLIPGVWSMLDARRVLLGCRLAPKQPLLDTTERPPTPEPTPRQRRSRHHPKQGSDDDSNSILTDDQMFDLIYERSQSYASDWSDAESSVDGSTPQKRGRKKKKHHHQQQAESASQSFDDYFAEFEYSAAEVHSVTDHDEDSDVSNTTTTPPGIQAPAEHLQQLRPGIQVRSKKRQREDMEGTPPQPITERYKRQRRNSTGSNSSSQVDSMDIESKEESGGEKQEQPTAVSGRFPSQYNTQIFQYWNSLCHLLTRKELITLPFQSYRLGGGGGGAMHHVALGDLKCQVELCAALEDCIQRRPAFLESIEESELEDVVMFNQNFVDSLVLSNHHYLVYMGRDNIHKLYRVQSDWFKNSNFITDISQQVQQKSPSYQTRINVCFVENNCRMFFDHEMFYIPAAIHALAHPYPMQTGRRLIIEFLFEALVRVYRQDFITTPVTNPSLYNLFVPPPPIPLPQQPSQSMPPPPARPPTPAKKKGNVFRVYNPHKQ